MIQTNPKLDYILECTYIKINEVPKFVKEKSFSNCLYNNHNDNNVDNTKCISELDYKIF